MSEWCEHCRDHFPASHYGVDNDGKACHMVGPEYGPVGVDLANNTLLKEFAQLVENNWEGITEDNDAHYCIYCLAFCPVHRSDHKPDCEAMKLLNEYERINGK